MPEGLILLVPAVLAVIGLVLMVLAVGVLVSTWRTYLRGQDPKARTKPQPLSHAVLISGWTGLVCVVGGLVAGAGVVIAVRIVVNGSM